MTGYVTTLFLFLACTHDYLYTKSAFVSQSMLDGLIWSIWEHRSLPPGHNSLFLSHSFSCATRILEASSS